MAAALLSAALPGGALDSWPPSATRWPLPFAVPSALAPLPGGSLLVASRDDGTIWRFDASGTLAPTPIVDLPSSAPAGHEYGLLGLALNPDYPASPWVYVFFTDAPNGQGLRFQRIQRFVYFEDAPQIGPVIEQIITELPADLVGSNNGGRIRFGPDRMLYATVGDGGVAPLAQVPFVAHGSVLRTDAQGQNVPGNPWPASTVAVTGLQNPRGLTFDPEWGMIVSDLGPREPPALAGFDEVNRLAVGDNAGWPLAHGDLAPPATVAPSWHSGPALLGPSGALVPRTSQVPAWDGKILWCNAEAGVALVLDPAAAAPAADVAFPDCKYDVAQDAQGRILFATGGGIWVVGA